MLYTHSHSAIHTTTIQYVNDSTTITMQIQCAIDNIYR